MTLLTGALMPFAIEQLAPLLQLHALLLRRSQQHAVVSVGSGAMVGVNVHISGGLNPRGDNGAGFLCLSIKSSTVREVQVSHQRD